MTFSTCVGDDNVEDANNSLLCFSTGVRLSRAVDQLSISFNMCANCEAISFLRKHEGMTQAECTSNSRQMHPAFWRHIIPSGLLVTQASDGKTHYPCITWSYRSSAVIGDSRVCAVNWTQEMPFCDKGYA